MLKIFRWLFVLPIAVLAWYAALILGIFLISFASGLCPPESVVSGLCMAQWYPKVERAVFYLCTAISAIFVVIAPALSAPSHRLYVAYVAFLVGGGVALYMALPPKMYGEFLSSVLAGGAAVILLKRILRQKVSA